MSILDVILIGVALSIDACALTIANCTTYKSTLTRKKEWYMPIAFAIFQGAMPLIGFLIGYLFRDYIGTVIKYISAGIFFILAGKIVFDIIRDAFKEKCIMEVKECKKTVQFTITLLLIQAVATSIDALSVGVTFIDLNFSVYLAVLIIAVITFTLVSLALFFGKYLGKLFGKYAEWVGAIILFAIAIKTLLEAIIG